MRKHIARILTIALVLGMLGVSALAATVLPESKGHLQASNASTGSITKDFNDYNVVLKDEVVLQFPAGTEFSVADGIDLRVSSYDGKKFNLVTAMPKGETYTLETPGIICCIAVNDESFSSFKTYVMIADGTGTAPAPTEPAQPATPPLSEILRTETRMVTVHGQAAKEVTIYYIPEGGGDFVGGSQPVSELSLNGTHTDAATGKTVYDLKISGFFGVDTSMNWLNAVDTIIEVGSSEDGEDGSVDPCFYVAFEGCTLFSSADAPASTVAPSPCKATLDGKDITLNSYLFTEGSGGTNYVMLRDIAYLLNGSEAQFEVTWDKNKGIVLTTGQPYTAVGGELQSKGDGAKAYTKNASNITIDGKSVELTAYTIEGNNYFKLRDLSNALCFDVDWDGNTSTVNITTK